MAARHERLTHPLVRESGRLRRAGWDEALDLAAAGLGAEAGAGVGVFSCSKATNETNFVVQKLARVALRTNNIDSCNRT
jgi:formate dehydrogenase major subunit